MFDFEMWLKMFEQLETMVVQWLESAILSTIKYIPLNNSNWLETSEAYGWFRNVIDTIWWQWIKQLWMACLWAEDGSLIGGWWLVDGRLGYGWCKGGWLGNGRTGNVMAMDGNAMVMDSLTVMRQQWSKWTEMGGSTATTIDGTAMVGLAMDGALVMEGLREQRNDDGWREGDGHRDGNGDGRLVGNATAMDRQRWWTSRQWRQ
jgi:hypothetical protein